MSGANQFRHINGPAGDDDLAALKGRLGHGLPAAYEEFLRESDGAEGGPNDIGGDSLRVFAVRELCEINKGYRVDEYLPFVLCFADDGGSYAFGFDRRSSPEPDGWNVIRVGYGSLFEDEMSVVAESFGDWVADGFRYTD